MRESERESERASERERERESEREREREMHACTKAQAHGYTSSCVLAMTHEPTYSIAYIIILIYKNIIRVYISLYNNIIE